MIWKILYKCTFDNANVKQISKMVKHYYDKRDKPLDHFIDFTTNHKLL